MRWKLAAWCNNGGQLRHSFAATPKPLGTSPGDRVRQSELLSRQGPALRVRGLDMLDGTPILDIKPYLSDAPAERFRRGWLAEAEARKRAAT